MGTIVTVLFFMTLLTILFFLPVTNYHHTGGIVEFRRQSTIVSQAEGVIDRVFVKNHAIVRTGDTLFGYTSNTNKQEVIYLTLHKNRIEKEIERLRILLKTGTISKSILLEKELELQETWAQLAFFQESKVYAPDSGELFFALNPDLLKGTYIRKGDITAYIITDPQKHIRITIPNEFADRFKMGNMVIVKYKDPGTFRTGKMTGTITSSFINIQDKKIDLFCDMVKGKELLERFKPFTAVATSILINETSIAEDLFNIR